MNDALEEKLRELRTVREVLGQTDEECAAIVAEMKKAIYEKDFEKAVFLREREIELKELRDAFMKVDDQLRQAIAGLASTHVKNASSSQSTKPHAVFIVHGHDELNLMKLQRLLADRLKIRPLVLAHKPGRGRTLIEKFEEEAEAATFAFVILTPDDTIAAPNGEYAQARPNVIFELGWLYGRLGRRHVTLLFKKGTKIHSDLDGLSRIEFHHSVDEKLEEIERELTDAGLLHD